MSDLKLIDELLCHILQSERLTWAGLEGHTSVTALAMLRLRAAYRCGEMPVITLGLADYFESSGTARRQKSGPTSLLPGPGNE